MMLCKGILDQLIFEVQINSRYRLEFRLEVKTLISSIWIRIYKIVIDAE